MKNLFIVLWMLIGSATQATNYYFSNTGSDSNNGLSPLSPKQTITAANALILSAGDSVLFKCGNTFNEQFIVPASGSVGNPIVISSYETGVKPIFSSQILTASWTLIGSGVYSTTGWSGSIYAFLWEGNKSIAKASSSACSDGQWYYSAGTTYYKPTSGTPADHVIQYARLYGSTGNYTAGINVSDRSYITITGLQFQRCGEGITSWDSGAGTTGIEIKNCEFYYSQDGVLLLPGANHNSNALIHDNYFKWCHNAVRLYCTLATKAGETTASQNKNCKIYSNEMDECGTIDGTTLWSSLYGTDYEAIGLNNIQNCLIYENYIHGGHQIGVNIWNIANQYGRNNLVYRNHIKDNGYTPISLDGNPASIGYSGNWIFYNLIINSGNASGFTFSQGLSETGMNYFVNNTCTGDWAGFKLYTTYNAAMYLTIQNNLFFATDIYYSRINGVPTNLLINNNMYQHKSGGSQSFLVNNAVKTFAEFQAMGYETNGSINDPLFVSSNYQLQSISPAINSGAILGLTTDYLNHAIVDIPDLGCYEYLNFSGRKVGRYNGKTLVYNGKILKM